MSNSSRDGVVADGHTSSDRQVSPHAMSKNNTRSRKQRYDNQSVFLKRRDARACIYHRLKKLHESACNELMKMQDSAAEVAPLGFTEVKMRTNSVMPLSTAPVQNVQLRRRYLARLSLIRYCSVNIWKISILTEGPKFPIIVPNAH